MVPTMKLHLLAEERRPRGVPASRLEGVVVRKGKGKGKGGHAESLLFDPGDTSPPSLYDPRGSPRPASRYSSVIHIPGRYTRPGYETTVVA
jgi:hypothetical protein